MAGSAVDTKLLRLKWRRAFDRWERKAARWTDAIKAGFDPNQPRVPAGSPDGGQWTGTGGGTRVAQAGPNRPKKPAVRKPKKPKLHVPVERTRNRTNRSLEAPPKVTKRKPPTTRERNRTAREIAKWLRKAGKAPAPGQIKLFLYAIEGISWLYELYPFIQSYLDGPKSLDRLNKDARTRRTGYEKHHIVEQTPAEQDGFSRELIDAPENIVSVPKYKHEDISGHYQKKNPKLGDKSLRDHLRGKSWEERLQKGLEVLEEFGVLGP